MIKNKSLYRQKEPWVLPNLRSFIFRKSPPETAYKKDVGMDTDFAWSERKTFGCGMGEIPETLYAEAGRLPG